MFRNYARLALGVAIVVAARGSSQLVSAEIQWSGGNNIDWPCSTTKNFYKSSGRYVNRNIIATRAAVHKDDVFLALPRYRPGVPFTLAKMSLKSRNSQSKLGPFPCWSLQEVGNCLALQNVVDIFLDPQGILWALDVGVVDSISEPRRLCPPKVLAVNVKSGKVVRRLDLSSLATASSELQFVVADYGRDGRAFVYVADAANRAILVFDAASGRGYRVILPAAAGRGVTQEDGLLLHMALIRRAAQPNALVFGYFGSNRLFSIGTPSLQNGSIHGSLTDIGPTKRKLVFLGTDGGSAVFFRRQGQPDIYRWELRDKPSLQDVRKVYHGTPYALPSQVTPDLKRGRMRVLESNYPDFFRGTVGCGVNQYIRLF